MTWKRNNCDALHVNLLLVMFNQSADMKKSLLFIIALVFSMTVYTENKGFSRWSFAPEYGYDILDGDVSQPSFHMIPTSVKKITYGASLEYALTPVWGLSVDYYFFPLRALSLSPVADVNTDLHNTNLNATINFTRLIFPQSKSRFYFTGALGIGYSYYTFNTTPPSTEITAKNSQSVTVPVVFALEYNFSRPFSLGAKVQYRAFNKDNLEGLKLAKGVTNDFVGAGTIFLRYKFNSRKKDHLRNIKMDVYRPDEGLVLARHNSDQIQKLDSSLHKLEKKVDVQVKRIDSLYVTLSNEGPDTDNDGVPDVRDLEQNTPPNTPVDFWGKELNIPGQVVTPQEMYQDIPAVYFDFDRFDLDDNAIIAISKIAARMKADPSLYVEVRGYCDYSGNNPYNNQLSQRRSDRVKVELTRVWKIPANHIISNGKGKVLEPRLKYKPNRRCDFFFGKL